MATPPASDDAPPPTGSPLFVRKRRRARIIVGAIGLVGVATLLVVFLLTREPAEEGFQSGDEFTCSDGTFTMTLPEGWVDYTDEYRTAYLEDSGTESGIEGFISVDGLPFFAAGDFVTISGHPVLTAMPASGDFLLEDSSSYWAGRFDDLESSVSGESTSDAGDEILYTTLRGTEGSRDWQVVLVFVMGEDSYAEFILESREDHDLVKDALLASVNTLIFNPLDSIDTEIDHEWYLPHDDGRTYSSEGGASIVIPESWIFIGEMWDADALNPTIKFDFLGLWQIGETENDNPMEIQSASIQVSLNGYPELTAVEQLMGQFGAVGETTTDSGGVRYTVEAIEPWTAPGAEDAAWIRLLADYEATGETFFEGRIVDRIGYLLIHDNYKIVAFLEFPGSLDETVLSSFEETLKTIEFRP
ncbi:MAG: hypothetical protein JW722_06735 [Demequinaceae bacterium]|nr:hypothetical protein [Demequinaceae bacterium]